MDETPSSRGRSAVAGHPAGVAGRQSFRVLDPQPPPATVNPPMSLSARFTRAARLVCLATALGLLLLRGLGTPVPASAQSLTSIEFSFSNPGARSLGFGGAFVALADDATAAFANPAGLVQIAKPEISLEGRSWAYRTPFTQGGRASGEPTGLGIDEATGPQRGESRDDLAGLSYLSYVYPRHNWSFAVFQHQLANFEFTLETQGVFGPVPDSDLTTRTGIERGRIDLEILTRGVAVAFRPIDSLSLGLGLTYFEPRSRFHGEDYRPDDDSLAAFFSPASFLPERLVQVVDFRWDEPKWGLSAGLLWRLSDRWTLGGLYRQTPELPVKIDVVAGPAHPQLPAGARLVDGFRSAWDFPDVQALGLGYRSPNGRWTGACEWKRVEYSSIVDSLLPEQRGSGLFVEDADEIHLGAEYAFFASTSVVAVRLGAWHDPDHYFDVRDDEPLVRAVFVPGEDELHLAAGLGIALRRFQLDLAIDLSERIDTASLSVIYSFPG